MLLLLLSLAAVLASASTVEVMNDANFDRILTEKAPMMIEFYAPWCGHCKQLEPEYKLAAEKLKKMNSPVTLGKVDVTSEEAKELQKRFNINGFPTLKFFSSPSAEVKPINYEGERTATAISQWSHKKSGPAYTLLKDDAMEDQVMQMLLDDEKFAVVGFYPTEEHTAAFAKAASLDDKRDYFLRLGEGPSVTVLRWFDVKNPASSADPALVSNQAELAKFVETSSVPFTNVEIYTGDDVVEAKKGGIHLVEFYAPWCGYCKEFASGYEKVALHFKDEAEIRVAKCDGTEHEAVVEQERVDGFPTLKFYRNGASVKYTGELNADEVIDFVQAKLTAKAEEVTDLPAFTKLEVGLFAHAMVACVTEEGDAMVDLLAFEASSATFKVGRTRCPDLASQEVTLYNWRGVVAKTKEMDLSSLRQWYRRASIPKVWKFDDEVFGNVQEAEFSYVALAFTKDEASKEFVQHLEGMAQSGKFPDMSFTYAEPSLDYLLEYFHLQPDQLPLVYILDLAGEEEIEYYPGPVGEFTLAQLEEVYLKIKSGKLEKVTPPVDDTEDDEEEYDEEDEEEDEEYDQEEQDEL